ncbi:MAG: acyltransferase [Ktedonobacteraceae bacterium]
MTQTTQTCLTGIVSPVKHNEGKFEEASKNNIAALDGVRAMACILVVLYHSVGIIYTYWDISHVPFFLPTLIFFGAKGVTLFFILSGFLLFLPYGQALFFERRWPQARIFYLRRILRIVPGYYFSLFAIILLGKPSYLQPHNWKILFMFLTFLMTGPQSDQVNGVYWTLAVEFQYYMLLPLIALGIYGLTRVVRPKQRLWMIIGSLLIMVIWGLATDYWGSALFARPDAQTFLDSHPILKVIAFLTYGLPTNNHNGKFFEDFAVGMLLAVCYMVVINASRRDIYQHVLLRLSPWLWWIGVILLGFAAWRIGLFTFTDFEVYPAWAIEIAFALGFGCCVLAVLFNGSGVLKRFFEWTPLRCLGLISFSLYLWQRPIIDAIGENVAPTLFKRLSAPMALSLLLVLEYVVIVCVSFILYVLVEKPGIRLSEALRKKTLYVLRTGDLTLESTGQTNRT